MATYSFLDVQASIVGPGGLFSLSGAGNAEEGIAISMQEEKNTMVHGADGAPMHSLHAAKGGVVSVKLLKTSPLNAKLLAMYNLQTVSSAAHGLNTISLKNPVSGDSILCTQCAFAKLPDNINAKDAGSMDWVFHAGYVDQTLGGGLVANLATFGAGAV